MDKYSFKFWKKNLYHLSLKSNEKVLLRLLDRRCVNVVKGLLLSTLITRFVSQFQMLHEEDYYDFLYFDRILEAKVGKGNIITSYLS